MRLSDDIPNGENSKTSQEIQEEADTLKAYDSAKAEDDEIIPFDQAIREIETGQFA
ncbi:MAG: hypothetical protein R6W31_04890 [Bacteroidales bacterium]